MKIFCLVSNTQSTLCNKRSVKLIKTDNIFCCVIELILVTLILFFFTEPYPVLNLRINVNETEEGLIDLTWDTVGVGQNVTVKVSRSVYQLC